MDLSKTMSKSIIYRPFGVMVPSLTLLLLVTRPLPRDGGMAEGVVINRHSRHSTGIVGIVQA